MYFIHTIKMHALIPVCKRGRQCVPFYGGLWCDLAGTRTHDLPHEADMLTINAQHTRPSFLSETGLIKYWSEHSIFVRLVSAHMICFYHRQKIRHTLRFLSECQMARDPIFFYQCLCFDQSMRCQCWITSLRFFSDKSWFI